MNEHLKSSVAFAQNWLSPTNVELNLEAHSELEAILALLNLVKHQHPDENIKQLAQELLRHEILTPSAHGCCSIVFRVLSGIVARPEIFLGRFKEGIGYVSRNGQPIDFLVLVVAPPEMQEPFQQVVSRLEEALCTLEVNRRLREATDADAVLQVFVNSVFGSEV